MEPAENRKEWSGKQKKKLERIVFWRRWEVRFNQAVFCRIIEREERIKELIVITGIG